MPRTDLLTVLKHRWATILICTLLGGVGVLGATVLAEPRYTSTTTLHFSIRLGNTPTELNQGRAYTQSQMSSFAALATSPVVLNQVIDEMELEASAAGLAQQISASVPTETVLLNISATSADREQAADIANAVAEEVGDYATETSPSSGGRSLLRVESLRTAAPAVQPSSPRPRRDVAAGLLAGLFIGLLLAVFREQRHRPVRSIADLKEATGLPVLATLPGRSDRPTDEVVSDAHRRLRLGLDDRMQGSPRALVFAAVSSHGDVDEVVRSVATAYAETGANVVHVDTQAGLGDEDVLPGLPDVLRGRVPLVDALVGLAEGYWVLPAGMPDAPVPVLSSPEAREVLKQLSASFDVVLVSCSDVRSSADAAVLARTAGPLLLVTVLDADRVPEVTSAVDDLRAVGVPLLGLVMVDPHLGRRRRRLQPQRAGAAETTTGDVPDSGEPVRWSSGQPQAALPDRRSG